MNFLSLWPTTDYRKLHQSYDYNTRGVGSFLFSFLFRSLITPPKERCPSLETGLPHAYLHHQIRMVPSSGSTTTRPSDLSFQSLQQQAPATRYGETKNVRNIIVLVVYFFIYETYSLSYSRILRYHILSQNKRGHRPCPILTPYPLHSLRISRFIWLITPPSHLRHRRRNFIQTKRHPNHQTTGSPNLNTRLSRLTTNRRTLYHLT
jgi:hypothetical protein